MNWLIITPVWGQRCLDLFCGPALDSHACALANIEGNVRYLCHTDDALRVSASVRRTTGKPVRCPPLPTANGYDVFIKANREALADARPDEIVVVLNADMIVSRETFSAIEKRIAEGKKVIMCAGTRTLPKEPVPRNASSRELLSWSLDNQHPLMERNYYGTGMSRLPATIYFRDGDAVMLRGFHLHPLAFVIDRKLNYSSTVDWDMASNYAPDEVHVVTEIDELATAEISPIEKNHDVGKTPFNAQDILRWAKNRTIPFHWWLFNHRIKLRGDGVFNDESLVRELVEGHVHYYAERPPRKSRVVITRPAP